MEETQSERLQRKIREQPFMPIGVVGLIGALGYGAYKYNRRGTMSRSLFFVQLRVGAQGMVVGALCISIGLEMFKRLTKTPVQKEQ